MEIVKRIEALSPESSHLMGGLQNKVEAFTLAHLSDLHLSSLNGVGIRALVNKRILGYLSWRLRRKAEHDGAVLKALLQDLQRCKPDHIAVTGDLTHLGLPQEFQEARDFLLRLGPPHKVTVIPGNHDAYISTSWNRTFSLWADYMLSDELETGIDKESENQSIFPSLRIRGNAALIGVSSAVPSAPFFAVGSIGKNQLERLKTILTEIRRKNLFRVLLIHHPPLGGTVRWRKRLTDAAPLRSLLEDYGTELVLHGHAHKTSMTSMRTTAGRAEVIGVPSATSLGRNPGSGARYHLYALSRSEKHWKLQLFVRGYSRMKKRFVSEEARDLPYL
jgi:3',5'-cyclic AMP phosphodiesterase CpdA